ncbi:TPA: N-acetylmuramoyl-L-alanine amidase [Clostridium botulinum]
MVTSIMGVPQVTIEQCELFLHDVNPKAPYLANIYKKYCDIYGIKLEIAWVQMCLETNFLRYSDTSITTLDMHNYAGLGALDGNGRKQALKFNTENEGVECHIQHLFAYCSKNNLPQGKKLIDPRFKYVDRGCAINVEDLGSGKWASDKQYANKLLDLLGRLINTKTEKKGDNVMSKGIISYDFGHMEGGEDTSANGILYEYSVVRNYGSVVVRELQKAGYTLVNCTPPNGRMSLSQSLSYRVNKANSSGSMLHLCFHANCYNGNAYGCEMEVASDSSERIGQSIQNEVVSSLGFANRGVKRPSLYVTRNTNMPCVLTEPFFIDNRGDCNKYNVEKLGCAIATGVLKALGNNYRPSTGGNNSSSSSSPSKPTAIVTASALNVREQKSTSSKILGVLPNGKSVEVYKVEGDWVHIYYPPHGGFISKQYVKLYNIPDSIVQKPNKPVEKKEEKKMDIILYFGETDKYCAEMLSYELKLPVLSLRDFKGNSKLKNNTGIVYMVGGSEKPVNNTTLITGNNRVNTAQAVVNYIKNLK